MKLFCSLFFLACLGLAKTVSGTTVIPPSFDRLVSDAEMIFEGTVTDLRSEWAGEGTDRHIVTYVTFKVEDALKGALGPDYTIRMMGGTIDGKTLEVTDAPRFKVGDRDILFVEHNGTQFIPLVGIMHGRFRIKPDDHSSEEKIAKDNGAAVANVAKLGQDEKAATTGRALTKAEFKAAIRQKIAEKAGK
ncbi:MAG TPA: hypothetical protein VM940_10810 [Chthoniobacterales bacterium]|jgi:hypothetical protein|nr:hypothetical protein [Chthoniobacterales bacterium]